MAGTWVRVPEVAKHFRGGLWPLASYQLDHVPWEGCAAWDLIQPAFMFMVGVAVPYSFARRQQEGRPFGLMLWQAVRRAATLVLRAVFLSSAWSRRTNFTFNNVLAQIGLGYVFVFLLCGRGAKVQAAAVVGILAASWLLFFAYPAPQPGPDFDYARYGLPENWRLFSGLAAHWNKHTNVASQFDLWFLNLFPRENPYTLAPRVTPEGLRYGEGYATLNFIPSIAVYCMAQLIKPSIWSMLQIHVGPLVQWRPIAYLLSLIFGPNGFNPYYLPIVQSASVLLMLWLICYWLYRQKIFIRI